MRIVERLYSIYTRLFWVIWKEYCKLNFGLRVTATYNQTGGKNAQKWVILIAFYMLENPSKAIASQITSIKIASIFIDRDVMSSTTVIACVSPFYIPARHETEEGI